jgi:uncharacterized UPF0146 family protein
MKTKITIIYPLILILFVNCGRDLDQSKRYSEMKSEYDSLITQTNLIINEQKATADSLRKIRDDIFKTKAQNYKLPEINRKITNAAEVASKFEDIKKHLEAIRLFATNGEKVTKRLIYYKRKYIAYSITIQIHDENIMIQEITDGLSAKKYISKYLTEKKK